MTSYRGAGHRSYGVVIFCVLLTFVLSLSLQAQDQTSEDLPPETTTIIPGPNPLSTEATATEVTPTDAPVVEPTSPTPEDTQAPIVTVTSEPTTVIPTEAMATEVTPAAPTDATATQATATTVPPSDAALQETVTVTPTLPLAYRANFDGAYPVELSAKTGWTQVAVTGGQALQASTNSTPIVYKPAVFADGAVEARFQLNAGEGRVILKGYAAGLAADGTVTLYRDQLGISTVSLDPVSPALLRLEVRGSQINISIDGVLALNYTDAAPLPMGTAGFAASSNAMLRVDDFAIYGQGVTAQPTPAPTADSKSVPLPMALSAPTNVQISLNGSQMTLTWTDNSTTETAYIVERNGFGTFTLAADATSFSEVVNGCGLTVWYRVRSYDASTTTYSAYSDWVRITTAPCAPAPCDANATIHRVSVGSGGTYQTTESWNTLPIRISLTGQSVLLQSRTPLTSDANELTLEVGPLEDVYRYDTQTCTTTKVSVGDTENESTAWAELGLFVDAAGTQALFESPSSGLASGGTGYTYLRDITQGTTTSISLPSLQGVDDLSADGRYALFLNNGTWSGGGITDANANADLVVYDRQTTAQMLVSVNAAGTTTANALAIAGSVFTDNNSLYVVFSSLASDHVAGDTNGKRDVFVRNLTSGVTTRVSLNDDETQIANASNFESAAVFNGQLLVAFTSESSPTLSLRTVSLSTPATGTTAIVGRGTGTSGTVATFVQNAGLSANGRWIAFDTNTALVAGVDTNGKFDVYVRDLVTNTTQRVSVGPNSVQLAYDSFVVGDGISADGSKVLLRSYSPDLAPNDTNFLCESDNADSDPNTPGNQADHNESCADLFLFANPLHVGTTVSGLAPTSGGTMTLAAGLSWQAANDWNPPYTYDIQIATDAGFTSIAQQATLLTPTSYHPVGLAEGLYYWRVRPVSQLGVAGAWAVSSATILDGVPPAAPVVGAVEFTETGYPRFNWTAVDTATSYIIEINDACGDGTFTYQVETTNTTSFQILNTDTRLLQGEYSTCIRAEDASGLQGPFSAQTPLRIAYNVTPKDGQAVAAGAPITLNYYSFGTAPNKYKFLIDDDPSFTTPVYEGGPVGYYNGIGAHTAPALSAGTYYWRVVRLTNDVADPMFSPVSFVMYVGTPGSAPALSAPAAETVINAPITLSWSPSATLPTAPALTHYQVHVSSQANFSDVIVQQNVPVASAQEYLYAPAMGTNDKTYYWRVVGYANSQALTAYETRTLYVDNVVPEAPLITSPSLHSTLYIKRPQFVWSNFEESSNLSFQIGLTNLTTQSVIVPAQTPSTSPFTPDVDLVPGSYEFKVWMKDRINISEPRIRYFTIEVPQPTMTSLTPNNGVLNRVNGLTWSVAEGGPFTYDIEISPDSDFTTIVEQASDLTERKYLPTTLVQGHYWWRVRGEDEIGTVGPWTTAQVNSVDPLPAPTPVTVEFTETGSPKFTWGAVPYATRYTIEVNNVCGDGTVSHQGAVNGTTYQLVGRLYQGDYSFCIRSEDAGSNKGSFGPQTPLKIAYNVEPRDGALITDGVTIPLRYFSLGDPNTTYKFYIDDEPTFTPPYTYENGPVGYYDGIGLHNAQGITTPGLYYWRVERLINGVAEPIHSPASFKLYIGRLGSAPTLTAPAHGATVNTPITLAWNQSSILPTFTTISHYQIQVSASASFDSVLVTQNIAPNAVQEYTFTPPENSEGTTFYWRVRGVNGSQIVTHDGIRNFTVNNAILMAPIITAPTANSTLIVARPTMTWRPVSSATGYKIAVQNAVTSTDVIAEQTITAATFTPNSDLASGSYVLRVQTLRNAEVSTWSTQPFTILLPVAPAPTQCPTFTVTPNYGQFMMNGDISYTIHNSSTTKPATFTGFQAVWGSAKSKISNLRLLKVTAGGNNADDVASPSNPNGQGVIAWQYIGGALTSPTNSTQTGNWLKSILLPPNSSTKIYFDFAGVGSATLEERGVNWTDFNNTVLNVLCFDATVPAPPITNVSPATGAMFITSGTATTLDIPFNWSYPNSDVVYTVQLQPAQGSIKTCTTNTLTCTIEDAGFGVYMWTITTDDGGYHMGHLSVSPPAPRAPTLVSPLNNRLLLSDERPRVLLMWSWGTMPAPLGDSFDYEVQVSHTADFADLTDTAVGMTTPQYLTASLNEDGTYYWRVRAFTEVGLPGAWSAPFSFIIDATPPSPAPVVSAPAVNAMLTTARPSFIWSASAGAARYKVEVNEVCGDGTPIHMSTTPITTTTYTIPAAMPALPQGDYVVCVKAYDQADNVRVSDPRPFTVFLGLNPVEGFFSSGGKPTFNWTAALETGKTVTYQLQIDSNGDFTGTDLLTTTPSTATSVAWATLLSAGTHYWRVVRFINGVAVDVDNPNSRTLFVGALTAGPNLTGPSTTIPINDATPLQWLAGPVPSGVTLTDYEVIISKSSTFASVHERAVVPASQLSYLFTPPTAQNRVMFYWRVRGLANDLPITNWASRTMLVDNVAPAKPAVIVSGADVNHLTDTVTPIISWTTVPTATQYRVTIYDGTTPRVTPQVITKTTFTTPVTLDQKQYVVVVEASDGLNWSEEGSYNFDVRLGTSPAHNAVITTNRPTLTWKSVPGATSYTVEVYKHGQMDTPLFTKTAAATSYLLPSVLAPGVYHWRVSANNLAVPVSDGMRTFTYGVALKPLNPFVASALTPTAADTVFNAEESAQLLFKWQPVNVPPVGHEIQISRLSTFPLVSTISLWSSVLDGSTLDDGVHYWRVRALYGNDGLTLTYGPWSDTKSFTLDRTLPVPPVLTVPAMSATLSTGRPSFRWTASTGASRYLVDVVDATTTDEIAQWDDLLSTSVSYVPPTTKQPLNQNNTTGYLWTVHAQDAAGNTGTGTPTMKFFLFSGVSPSYGQFLTDTTPLFTWTGVTGTGAAPWILEISTSETMSPLVYSSPTPMVAGTTNFTLPHALTTPGMYYWRVYRVTEDKTVIKGQPFYVGPMNSVTPQPTTPVSGKWLNPQTLTFEWLPRLVNSPTTLEPNGYRFELATSSTFGTTTKVARLTTEPSLELIEPLPDGTYYWRVQASYINARILGPMSPMFTVRIDRTATSMVNTTAPIVNAILTTRTPTFNWTAATGGPTDYVLTITAPGGYPTRYQTTVKTPTLTHTLPIESALTNGSYEWWIVVKDAAGNTSFSNTGRFTIAAP